MEITLVFLSVFFLGILSDLYPSSCIDLEDGTYDLKLSNDLSKPLVSMKCYKEYAILDYQHDNNLQEYFRTWDSWYPEFIGPSNDYILNWEEWINFYDNDTNMSMTLSPDCSECDISYDNPKYAYYLTGTIFGCAWNKIGLRDCDYHYEESLDSYVCHDCNTAYAPTLMSHDLKWLDEPHTQVGVCPIYISDSNHAVPTDHGQCMTRGVDNLKPSLGIKGQFCVCVKPTIPEYFEYSVAKTNNQDSTEDSDTEDDDTEDDDNTENDTEEDDDSDNDNDSDIDTEDGINKVLKTNGKIGVKGKITQKGETSIDKNRHSAIHKDVKIYINQDSFKHGPLRIKEPGIYILEEDIKFEFGDENFDNVFDGDSWWPTDDDVEDYPGAADTHSPWFMGYFAGITVESDFVTLDLNGYEIGMSDVFYLVQRWFTNIELSTQYFNPGEGPFSSFGGNPFYASNVVIKNGKLGLTSHHSIHGNNNHNIVLKDLDISKFETHGIHLNGFEFLTIENVDVHDNSRQAYLTESFGHVKALIPFIKKFSDDNGDKKIRFKGDDEDTTWNEVLETVEEQLNAIFRYVYYNEEPEIGVDISAKDWEEAKTLYYNKDGYFYGSSVHGLFLNSFGAQVFKYRLKTSYPSEFLTLNNVRIYNLYHKMQEAVSAKFNKVISTTYFASPYKIRDLYPKNFVNVYDANDTTKTYDFKLNSFVKLHALYYNFVPSNQFGYLGSGTLPIHEVVINYRYHSENLQGSAKAIAAKKVTLMCGTDGMMHPGKGITGMRIEGVSQALINNVKIYNLYEKTPLGSELCGKYAEGAGTTVPSSGTFRYTYPIQKGFSGNNLQGILISASSNIKLSNISVVNLTSDYGLSYGISLWPNTQTTFDEKIEIQNLNAGDKLEKDLYTYEDSPNFAPDACGIMLYEYFVDSTYGIDEPLASTYQVTKNIDFDISNINGHYGCLGTELETLVGYPSKNKIKKNNKNDNKNKNSNTFVFSKSSIIISIFMLISIIISAIIAFSRYTTKKETIQYKSIPTYQTF